jgi:hypothetical protein
MSVLKSGSALRRRFFVQVIRQAGVPFTSSNFSFRKTSARRYLAKTEIGTCRLTSTFSAL